MKRVLFLTLVVMIGLTSFAQNGKTTVSASKTNKTIIIQTNGVCQKCADLFKEKVPYFKGVKDYSYNMSSSKITIVYDASKTNPAELRKQISLLGYDADDVKADAAARAKLPNCCKMPKSGNTHQCPNHQGCGNHH